MNSASDNFQRLSTRALQAAARPSTYSTVLLLLPAMTGVTSTLPAQANAAGPPARLALIAYADSGLDRVCAGESVEFSVVAIRLNNPTVRINDVSVRNSVLDPSVGTLSPASRRTSELSTPSGSVPFTFSGLRPGTTELRFDGVMRAGGAGYETDTLKRRVRVISCGSPTQPVQPPVSGGGANSAGPASRGTASPSSGLTRISKIKVSTRSTWSVGMDIRATIEDGVMVDDGQGHFDGLASVTWWTSVIGSAGCRAAEYTIPPSKAALAGAIDASNKLVVRITFEPRDFSGFATCGPTVATGNVGTLDPVTVTVPTTGGTSAQAHSVTARNGSFAGLVTVVVSTEVTSPVATSPRATSPVSRSPAAASPVAPPGPATPLDTSRPVIPRVPTAAAPTGLPLVAVLVAPSPGSTLSGGSATFSWTAGTGADGYWLDVGPTAGSRSFFTGPVVGLSKAVAGLPQNGSTIHVRLWTRIAGVWQPPIDYSYTAGR